MTRFSAKLTSTYGKNRCLLIFILHRSGIIELRPIFRTRSPPVSCGMTTQIRNTGPARRRRVLGPQVSGVGAWGSWGRRSHSQPSRLRRLSSLQTEPGGVLLKLFRHSSPGCRRLGLARRIAGRGCPSNCGRLCRAPFPGRQAAESVGAPHLISGAGVGRIGPLLLHCFPAFFRYTELVRRSVNLWSVVELKSDSEPDRRLHKLNWAFQADMPSPEPAERDSFEEFQKVWQRSNPVQDALDGGAGQEHTDGNEGMLVESARSTNIANSQ